MNPAEIVKTGQTVLITGLIAGAAYWLYKSKLGGLIIDAGETAAGAADYVIGSLKNAGAFVYEDIWQKGTGEGMSQLGYLFRGENPYGSRVEATSAYVVVRQRDFNSNWTMSETAYKAAVGMHPGNKDILTRYVLTGMGLKTHLQALVKATDFVVVFQDGSTRNG